MCWVAISRGARRSRGELCNALLVAYNALLITVKGSNGVLTISGNPVTTVSGIYHVLIVFYTGFYTVEFFE